MTVSATSTARLDEIVGRYRAQIERSADHALDAMEVDDDITPREFADLLRLRFSTGRPALPADWLPGTMMSRRTATSRDVRAGCFVCHGSEAHWTHAGAQGTAAAHHDATGHATWSDVVLMVRYGQSTADPRQVELEDAIAAAGPGTGPRPEATPHPDPDAPAVTAAGVSAPQGRPSRRAADRRHGARGREPETVSP